MRRVSFSERMAPYLRSGRVDSRLLNEPLSAQTPFGPLGRILAPVLGDVVKRINRYNPTSESLARRLRRAGLELSASDFRARQLIWAAVSAFCCSVLIGLGIAAGNFNPTLAVVLLIGSCLGGYLLRDWWLGEQITRRSRRILAQFPTIAELMALAVGAGESTLGAVERVCRISRGDLRDEFAATLADVRSGRSLVAAMQGMSDRVRLTAMTRFVDAIVVATERGTPIAAVMRAQAQDVRDTAKRELMETAGRKEISMMVPVVFGILPLTIVFAVFPGISLIDMNY
ncbi:type II secretion system F family protein [Paeniglutamicibacter cryotolerans]|nr:type II secretion system F family protein [Paeniglutamicibacter cryotolerans]